MKHKGPDCFIISNDEIRATVHNAVKQPSSCIATRIHRGLLWQVQEATSIGGNSRWLWRAHRTHPELDQLSTLVASPWAALLLKRMSAPEVLCCCRADPEKQCNGLSRFYKAEAPAYVNAICRILQGDAVREGHWLCLVQNDMLV